MSERTFFTLRYALPGYTFILMSILVAFPELQDSFSQIKDAPLVGAFLAFLYLLSGGAIGFLVSQPWYVVFNRFIAGRYGKLPEMRDFLQKKYRLTDKIRHQIVFADYVHRLSDKETLIYTQRRYDLMHLCGSTFVAATIGLIFGLFIRIDLFRMDITLWKAIESLSSISIGSPEITMYDSGVILAAGILLVLLFVGTYNAGKEEAMALDFSVRKVVNSGNFLDWTARKVFSDDYFINQYRNEGCL